MKPKHKSQNEMRATANLPTFDNWEMYAAVEAAFKDYQLDDRTFHNDGGPSMVMPDGFEIYVPWRNPEADDVRRIMLMIPSARHDGRPVSTGDVSMEFDTPLDALAYYEALNAETLDVACLLVQERLDVSDGLNASMHFSGSDNCETLWPDLNVLARNKRFAPYWINEKATSDAEVERRLIEQFGSEDVAGLRAALARYQPTEAQSHGAQLFNAMIKLELSADDWADLIGPDSDGQKPHDKCDANIHAFAAAFVATGGGVDVGDEKAMAMMDAIQSVAAEYRKVIKA